MTKLEPTVDAGAGADLDGRVFVVTGANTGIGRVTAHQLAKRGARVVLACRSEDKTQPVIEDIRADTGNTAIDFLALDLADLGKVRDAAEELLARDHPIHCLINNAGLAGFRGETADGFELAFGVNHLGHFLFTDLLLDKIVASAPSRIVTVASKAHYRAEGIDFEAVQKPTATRTGFPEYQVSKLANVLFSAELARRLEARDDADRVTTYSLHPGVIASDVWRRVPWPFRPLIKAFMKSTEDGAKTTLHCATASGLESESGAYYDECEQREASSVARDEAVAAELWDRSAEWCSPSAG